MKRRTFVLGTAAAGAGIALVPEGCSSPGGSLGTVLNGGYTLNVQYATTTFGPYTLRTRTYNGSTAGPTLEITPGSTFNVTVNNTLPPNPPATIPASSHGVHVATYSNMQDVMRGRPSGTRLQSGTVDPMDNPHSFNTTNLHVHGIQTVPHLYEPVGTSDPNAMMIAIEPGQRKTYSFPIPYDHPSGLFWYHPHHHGSTDVQVSGGMAGLIIVRGPIDKVPEIAAAREVTMVVQSLNVNGPNNGVYDYEPVAYQTPSAANPNAYTGGTAFTMMTVNGQGVLWVNNNANNQTVAGQVLTPPTITMQPGEVIRLRFLNGTNGWFLPLLFGKMNCYLIAFDGVNLLAPVKATFDFPGTVTELNVSNPSTNVLATAPGNRVELLIQAPSTPGSYPLTVASQNGIEFASGPFTLANFVVAGDPVTMSIPTSLPAPSREYPLIADSEIVARRTFTFHEGFTGPAGSNIILTGFYTWIDTALFDEMKVNVSPALNTAEEWTIINGTTCGHPFHIHVNSFELIEVNGVPVPPSIWDTFMVPPAQAMQSGSSFDGYTPPGQIKIRIRFKQWRGKSVFHCHILPHEDTGMMNNILIT